MRRVMCAVAIMLGITVLSAPGRAQEAAKKNVAIKPAPSVSQAVLEAWNDIGRKLIAMAEDFPDDKYDFKPTPAMRSFAERLIHAAHANEFFTNALRGQTMPGMDDPKR